MSEPAKIFFSRKPVSLNEWLHGKDSGANVSYPTDLGGQKDKENDHEQGDSSS
jgi:hypothetical protein